MLIEWEDYLPYWKDDCKHRMLFENYCNCQRVLVNIFAQFLKERLYFNFNFYDKHPAMSTYFFQWDHYNYILFSFEAFWVQIVNGVSAKFATCQKFHYFPKVWDLRKWHVRIFYRKGFNFSQEMLLLFHFLNFPCGRPLFERDPSPNEFSWLYYL